MRHIMKSLIKGQTLSAIQLRSREQRCIDLARNNREKAASKDKRIANDARVQAERDSEVFYNKYQNLRDRRINQLRKEARITFIAYGFLNGLKYSQIERIHHTDVDWVAVGKMIVMFGGNDIKLLKSFSTWGENAMKHCSAEKRQKFEEWYQTMLKVADEPTRKTENNPVAA